MYFWKSLCLYPHHAIMSDNGEEGIEPTKKMVGIVRLKAEQGNVQIFYGGSLLKRQLVIRL